MRIVARLAVEHIEGTVAALILLVDEPDLRGSLVEIGAHRKIVAARVFGQSAQPLRACAFGKPGNGKLFAGEFVKLRIARPEKPNEQKNRQCQEKSSDTAQHDQQLFLTFFHIDRLV